MRSPVHKFPSRSRVSTRWIIYERFIKLLSGLFRRKSVGYEWVEKHLWEPVQQFFPILSRKMPKRSIQSATFDIIFPSFHRRSSLLASHEIIQIIHSTDQQRIKTITSRNSLIFFHLRWFRIRKQIIMKVSKLNTLQGSHAILNLAKRCDEMSRLWKYLWVETRNIRCSKQLKQSPQAIRSSMFRLSEYFILARPTWHVHQALAELFKALQI